jgi:hypothetical protein
VFLIAYLVLVALDVLPFSASAWNIPGHMLSAAIAYQVLQQENPPTIDKVKAVLEKHAWYTNQWQARLEEVPVAEHGLVLFMQAARWPDDIRRDKQHHRGPWHCSPAFVNKIKTELGSRQCIAKCILDRSAGCGFNPKPEIKNPKLLGKENFSCC